MKSLADRISGEKMSDNSSNYGQCKNCAYRDKYNYQKYYCKKYTEDDGGKPDAFLLNKEKCKFKKASNSITDAADFLD